MSEKISIVIFGASGDLSQRKLIPALFNLFRKGRLPENFNILGFSTSAMGHSDFRDKAHAGVLQFAGYKFQEEEWQGFASHLFYLPGSFIEPADFQRLAASLTELENGPANRLFYLATPPRFFSEIVNALGANGLTSENGNWRRVVIEKPFGTDLASARALNRDLHKVLEERQIYRIDHYLGKETVQNILFFRFANSMFEPLWNRHYIDHVQITVSEEVGVGHRAGYFDGVGVFRDMFQNHLLQLLSLVAMEPPASNGFDDLREEKVKVLRSLRPISAEEVASATVRGQYRGYLQETGVAPDSQTETYTALRLYIDNWRWKDVPFYLRSGKHLAEKCTEIIIQFKTPPTAVLHLPRDAQITANILALCLQPDEGFHQRIEVKVPGTAVEMRSVDMEFHYRDAFGPDVIPEAYERLILDAITGDASLFTRGDRAELAWEFIDPILNAWHTSNGCPLSTYERGSWGPQEADLFMARDGRRWLRGCGGHQ